MANKIGDCSHPGCGKSDVYIVRGLCAAHYQRLRRHGDPSAGATFHGTALKFIDEVVLPFQGEVCLVWPYTRNGHGYAQLRIGGKSVGAYRHVCGLINGPAPTPDHEAAHSCGNGHLGCVNPQHLRWATSFENQADRLVHGTDCRGEKSPLAKLSAEQVLAIRRMEGATSPSEIARQFGTTLQNVRLIQKRKRWAWLSEEKAAA